MINYKFLHSLRTIGSFGDLRDGLASLNVIQSNFILALVMSEAFFKQTRESTILSIHYKNYNFKRLIMSQRYLQELFTKRLPTKGFMFKQSDFGHND